LSGVIAQIHQSQAILTGVQKEQPQMVAPNYAAARSALAKSMGLGRKAKAAQPDKARRTRS